MCKYKLKILIIFVIHVLHIHNLCNNLFFDMTSVRIVELNALKLHHGKTGQLIIHQFILHLMILVVEYFKIIKYFSNSKDR